MTPAVKTPEETAYLKTLEREAEQFSSHMAVVDYLNFRDSDGELITVASPPEQRYGVRSMAHVKVYGFTTLYLNRAAREALR